MCRPTPTFKIAAGRVFAYRRKANATLNAVSDLCQIHLPKNTIRTHADLT